MADDPRVQQLLDEIFESGCTPEEVCGACPELLMEVRLRWNQMCALEAELDALFPTATPDLHAGSLTPWPGGLELPRIAGYEVEAVLGRCGMGVVYKAKHVQLNRTVALKMLLAGAYAAPQDLARFRREAEALASLRHPNIAQVYDAGEVEGRPYFTMEFIDGGSLGQQLSATPQPPRRAAELVAVLAGAVQFAQRSGVVHRDLKPANILLTADGTPKITDFGLALLVRDGTRFTLSGARLGTPSYMAPEQALGKASDVGPAVDIYALGAVLYELVTGRPPFVGETASDTERQVIANEPVPPSRLNAAVPRDLETICLKCLQKNPARRYASARDVGDDLHRFVDGKPVVARPVGVFERAGKWARRRPALATLLAALLASLGAATGLGLWLQQQAHSGRIERAAREGRAREAIEATIKSAYNSGRDEHWETAKSILAGATSHLPYADSEALRLKVAQAHIDLQFAQHLESIRTMGKYGIVNNFYVAVPACPEQVEEYKKAFARADFDLEGRADAAVTRIRSAPLAGQTLAALDLWAFAAFKLNREPLQQQLLRIARLADPNPAWRDRLRDPAIWRDKQALFRLADDASQTAAQPLVAHQLAITGALLRDLQAPDEQTRLLRDGLDRHPGDFWLNWEMGHALAHTGRHAESAAYLRIVLALRPGITWIENALGAALWLAGDFYQSVWHLRAAVSRDPADVRLRSNFIFALISAGRLGEAEAECQSLREAEPGNVVPYHALGILLSRQNRDNDAALMFQKTCDLEPRNVPARCNLGSVLSRAGRHAEALAAFQQAIDLEKTSVIGHARAGECLAALGRHSEAVSEFLWTIRELDGDKKHADADNGDPPHRNYIDARTGLSESLLTLGRFQEGATAARSALDLPDLYAAQRQSLERQFKLSRQLAPLEGRLPAILGGEEETADVAALLAFADWCYEYRHFTATAVRLFDVAFVREPALAGDLQTQNRFHAACAAALAGNGLGADAGKLTAQERTVLRRRSLEWLRADRDLGVKRTKEGEIRDPGALAQALRGWPQNNDLACVREPSGLAHLPEAERKDWQDFWSNVRALAPADVSGTLDQARTLARRKQWSKAAECYAHLLKNVPNFLKDDRQYIGDILFELTAAQLLSGDRLGYRRTCHRMLAGVRDALQVRPYLVARACTLRPPDLLADV